MNAPSDLIGRLLESFIDLLLIIVSKLIFSGDVITAFLTISGLAIWAVAFGFGGYVAIRALTRAAWRKFDSDETLRFT
jgi:hypothetical protein